MRILGLIAVIAGAIAGAIALTIYLTSPRMYVQPNIRAFQRPVAPMPAGVVPVTDWPPPLPSETESRTLANPVPATSANIDRGATYYKYYCVFCHGEKGDGNGPVGESYVPKPSDLRSPKIMAYSDGEMLRAMLLGIGHEPVLEYVVHPEHRWYLVLYTRQLGSSPPGMAPNSR